jgi:adenylate kinase
MLERLVAVIGPPATGKTTLTMQLGQAPGRDVFRLREHVPDTMLAATATSADRLGWIDGVTVARALRLYIESVAADGATTLVLLDNFPGNCTQVQLLLSILRKAAPGCVVQAIELVADAATLRRRVRERRVCHRCERDPIHDPRLPASPNPSDPRRCGRCNSVLHPRRGDAPRLLKARMQRYQQAIPAIRAAFAEAGVAVEQINSDRPLEHTVCEVSTQLTMRSTPS